MLDYSGKVIARSETWIEPVSEIAVSRDANMFAFVRARQQAPIADLALLVGGFHDKALRN